MQDPSETVVWGGQLPSNRRAFTGGLSAIAIGSPLILLTPKHTSILQMHHFEREVAAAVLVSDLGGATRGLLGLDGGKLAGKLHLDVLYPVKGLKRCLDSQNGFGEQIANSSQTALFCPFIKPRAPKQGCCKLHCSAEFQYPASWLADQRMFRRNAERREQFRGLDPPSTGYKPADSYFA